MGKLKPPQTQLIALLADGYFGMDLFSNNYKLYIACMPWGTPFGLYTTDLGAQAACDHSDKSDLMVEWRKTNEKLDIKPLNELCFVMKLPLPPIISVFVENAEQVKDPQKHILSLLEDTSWIGDGLVEWAKKEWPDRWSQESEE